MKKRLINFMRKVFLSFFLLYGYNMIASSLNLMIPINIFTISFITFFGIPALFSLIVILIVGF